MSAATDKLKALLGVLVIAGGIYYAWNMVPPYVHNYQLQDDLDDIVRRSTYTTINEDDLRQVVIKKAQAMDIPLKEDQIIINKAFNGVSISVHYRIHVDMIVHPVDLDFSASSHNSVIGT